MYQPIFFFFSTPLPLPLPPQSLFQDNVVDAEAVLPTGPDLSFACRYCGRVHNTIQEQKRHSRTCIQCPFRCTSCNVGYSTAAGLARHGRQFHAPETKPFLCPHEECAQAFRDSSNLKRHVLRHHTTERHYPCPTCARRFKTNSDLWRHKKNIHGH
jgi:uncharacterized Zn-finger protein